MRPYVLVDDIEVAVREAADSGGEVAIPPMQALEDGGFALNIHGGIQYGLWKL